MTESDESGPATGAPPGFTVEMPDARAAPHQAADDLPDWPQSPSHVLFHYSSRADGEIDLSFRVDAPPGGMGDDPDAMLNAMHEEILASPEGPGEGAALRGISVADGTGDTVHFALTDAEPDDAPGGPHDDDPDAAFYRDFADAFDTRGDEADRAPGDGDSNDDGLDDALPF